MMRGIAGLYSGMAGTTLDMMVGGVATGLGSLVSDFSFAL